MKPLKVTYIASCIALAFSCQTAQAEESKGSSETVYRLDNITVSTQAEEQQDPLTMTQSVNAISRDTIQNLSPTNVPNALEIIPNVDIQGGPSSSNQNITIRGLPQSHAYVVIDGIYQSNYASKRGSWYLNPNLVNNIQVTAGPSSGAAAGKISISTISALDLLSEDEKFGAKVDLGYRSNNAQQDSGLTIFGKSGATDYLLSGNYMDKDAYEIGGGGSYYKTSGRQQSGLFKLGHQFSTDQRLQFTLNLDDTHGHQVRNDIGYRDEQYTGASLIWEDSGSDNPYLNLNTTIYYNGVDSYSAEQGRSAEQIQDIKDSSIGFVVSNDSIFSFATTDTLLHYGVSGHFTDHDGLIYDKDYDTGEITDDSATDEATTASRKLAAWVNYQLPITESLELIPGLRYDQFYIESANAVDANGQPLLRDGRSESRLSKSLNLNYYLSDDITLFASYAEALNAPRNGELFTSGRGFKPNPYLKSERADNKEIGAVWDTQALFSEQDSFTTRVNIFRNDIQDYIGTAYTDNENYPDGVKVNIGEARLEGFEFVSSYSLNDWNMSLSYGQTRGTDMTTGWYLADIPSDKFNLNIDTKINDSLLIGTRATYALTHDKVPTQQLGENGVIEEIPAAGFDAWFTMDLYASYTPMSIDGLVARLSVTNLFDKAYAHQLDFERDGTEKPVNEYYEEGRSINLQLSYQF
ncbi:TonB-dependent receptor [Shewanella sp. KX20019]|uniref:TonB-dependent receptor domain-containing protein n=1 Tax=Shewanella sp. KX20019 TaxID=2803864 RepID=UPI001927E1C0|nr:TonB-dependent receptor [Shewanella sp. KX20019]QQX78578.1 TonB-dependent receptor [Shewanella sp. KX20019]